MPRIAQVGGNKDGEKFKELTEKAISELGLEVSELRELAVSARCFHMNILSFFRGKFLMTTKSSVTDYGGMMAGISLGPHLPALTAVAYTHLLQIRQNF